MNNVSLLEPFVPPGIAPVLVDWLKRYNVKLTITRKRYSKFADYSPPAEKPYHRITVNHNLNPWSFLISLVHEMAHMFTWVKYRNSVTPHGIQWHGEFRRTITPFLRNNIFPEDIRIAIDKHLQKYFASSCTDPDLMRILTKYDKPSAKIRVENLVQGEQFMYKGILYRREEKARKNYNCLRVSDNRKYRFSPVAEVVKVQANKKQAQAG
ncbi:MAG: sprT domain-containing protein [Bacteroidetes bacterium]|nr:sprT domain-containing protein [Bacteroidota bacterium]